MTDVNIAERLNAMQRMLLPPSVVSETMQRNACCFWDNQDRILDGMKNFTNGWFERRHVGTHAALDASRRMCKAETPFDLLREYQEWATGAFERVTADCLACQQQALTVAGALMPSSLPSDDADKADASRSIAKPPTRSKAA